jgi:hypothetical protein
MKWNKLSYRTTIDDKEKAQPFGWAFSLFGSSGWARTSNLAVNSRSLHH